MHYKELHLANCSRGGAKSFGHPPLSANQLIRQFVGSFRPHSPDEAIRRRNPTQKWGKITQLKPEPCNPVPNALNTVAREMCSAQVNNTHPPKDGALLQCRSRGDPRKPHCVLLSLALQQRLRGTSQKYIWLVYTRRRDGYSQDSLCPHRNCLQRLPRGQSREKRHTTFIFTRWQGRRNYRTLVKGGCGK